MQAKEQKFVFSILIALFSFNILAWMIVFDLSKDPFLEVNFFDVGQGDAIFIETPKRHRILIDGGPSSIILEKLAREMPFWDRTIDLIILTHPESDHMLGLIEVLKRYKVENILWTAIVRNTPEYNEWTRLIKKEKSRIKAAQVGQKIIAGKTIINILYPFENLAGREFKDSNNTSIIAKLVFGQNSFLFTGDIYKSVEKELIENKSEIDSDVLKISHHGSKTSTLEDFVEKVSPEVAVIFVGKGNPYGHPHQEVLETLEKYGIKILRTDLDGNIKFFSDGKNYAISNF